MNVYKTTLHITQMRCIQGFDTNGGEHMKLTECEGEQLIEATRLWFARNGGVVDVTIKKVAEQHNHEHNDDVMPPGWSKHMPTTEVMTW